MTHQDFDKILEERLSKTRDKLKSKSDEYAHDNDRLYNFKKGSEITGKRIEEVAWGYALKHLVSVQDLIECNLKSTPDILDEKIGDLINYLILIEACFRETAPTGKRYFKVKDLLEKNMRKKL